MNIVSTLRSQLARGRNFDCESINGSLIEECSLQRIKLLGLADEEHYADYLEASPSEFATLIDCILSRVPKMLMGGAQPAVVAKLVEARLTTNHQPASPFRIWNMGCKTGLEPFALAIAISELLGAAWHKRRVKIFCTDSDETRLMEARQATFTLEDLSGLTVEARGRHFQSHGGERFSFKADLRRSIIFGKHDALKDPVISRIDLMVSQNFLLYHHIEDQHLLLDRMASALSRDGVLVLGEFERVPEPEHELFSTLNKSEKVLAIRSVFDRVPLQSVEESSKPEVVLLAAGFDSIAVAQVVIDSNGYLAAANARARSSFALMV